MRKNRALAVLLCLVLILCCGCGNTEINTEKTVTCQNLSMTVPSHYKNLLDQGYYSDCDFAYGYGELSIIGQIIPASALEDWEPTLKEYALNFTYANEINKMVETQDDFFTVCYETEGEVPFTWLAAFYQYSDGFWIVQCSCPSDVYPEMENEILETLHTVTFAE